MDTITLLIDEVSGVYIPAKFASNFDLKEWGLEPKTTNDTPLAEIESDLSSPENDQYWEAWDYVLENAKYRDLEGHTWTLHQDGSLFAVRDDHEWESEHAI